VNFGIEVAGQTAKDLVEACLAAGINFFDTAESYQDGASEITLGNIFKELKTPRSDIVVSSKIFWGGADRKNLKANDVGCSRKHIVEGTNAVLARLQMEYVDILYLHRRDPHTPLEETVRAMNHIIDQGKAFYWGTSEWGADDIREAQLIAEKLGLIGPIVEQPQYSLVARKRFEVEYRSLFDRCGLGSTVWSPLGGGVLTGKYNHVSRDALPADTRMTLDRLSWLTPLVLDGSQSGIPFLELQKRMQQLAELAKELDCSQGQLALAWVLSNKDVSTAIVGARNLNQLFENLGALNVVSKVDDAVKEKIEKIMQNKPEAAMDMTRRNERGGL
jgi:voltage-dependent potassium channel beta subunit